MKIVKFDINIIAIDEKITTVKMIKLNGEIFGFIRGSRNTSKLLPLSLISVDGEQIGDFHCEDCIAIFISKMIIRGIKPEITEHKRNIETHTINDPLGMLSAISIFATRKKEDQH
ncbi:TPA: hypothetical protein H2A59_002441 [Salmonella enterica]|nr:hypothetical protein [Salmonella enterica]